MRLKLATQKNRHGLLNHVRYKRKFKKIAKNGFPVDQKVKINDLRQSYTETLLLKKINTTQILAKNSQILKLAQKNAGLF